MGQILKSDKIGALTESGGSITLAASSADPTYITVGGQQYKATTPITRSSTADGALSANSVYFIYAVVSSGVLDLRFSSNPNITGPSGFSSWKMLGAFYTNLTTATFSYLSTGGSWLPFKSYGAGDEVDYQGYLVRCTVAHTASGSFINDSQSGYWKMSSAMTNHVINGNFDWWQRYGAPVAFAQSYNSADRILTFRQTGVGNANATASAQYVTSWLDAGQPLYCFRMQRNNTTSETTSMEMISAFESTNSRPLAGKLITFSFYARVGAGYTGGNSLTGYIGTGTGTDEGVVAAWTGMATPMLKSFSASTTWQRYTVTGILPINTSQIRWDVSWTPSGTAGPNDYVEVAQVMINEGPAPAVFQRAGANIQAELAMCQRYYAIVNYGATAFADNSLTTAGVSFKCPVPMRVAPGLTIVATPVLRAPGGDLNGSGSALQNTITNTHGGWTQVTGFSFGSLGQSLHDRGTSTWLAASAEL